MSSEPTRVPTLTEVVAAAAAPGADSEPQEPAAGAEPDEELLTQRILADLERRVDLMLEYRLREALGPALARASDTLIRELRVELASTLREVVAKAVVQELANRRER